VDSDLDVSVAAPIKSGALQVATKATPADVFVIAVPTPFKGDYKPDLSYVESATRELAPHNLVILEATSLVGTTLEASEWVAEERRPQTASLAP
jgi:UDP-N-acetyl-D-mannosaminuronic acid dehydrogenase